MTLVQNQKNIKFTIRTKLKSEVKVSDWLVERGATFPGSITEHGEADPMQSRRPIGKCLSLWEKAPQENKGKMKNEFSWINHRARGSWSNAIMTSNWKMLKIKNEFSLDFRESPSLGQALVLSKLLKIGVLRSINVWSVGLHCSDPQITSTR